MTDFAPLIARIKYAITLANISVYLGMLAILCFGIFGTLASLNSFKDSTLIYWLFHYLPYLLIAISLPISLYHLLLLARYRIVDLSILLMVFLVGMGLLLMTAVSFFYQETMSFFMWLFFMMIAWFAMPFLFRVNLRKFLNFLEEKQHHSQDFL